MECNFYLVVLPCCFYCYLWTYFKHFSSVDFEEINVSWVKVLIISFKSWGRPYWKHRFMYFIILTIPPRSIYFKFFVLLSCGSYLGHLYFLSFKNMNILFATYQNLLPERTFYDNSRVSLPLITDLINSTLWTF